MWNMSVINPEVQDQGGVPQAGIFETGNARAAIIAVGFGFCAAVLAGCETSDDKADKIDKSPKVECLDNVTQLEVGPYKDRGVRLDSLKGCVEVIKDLADENALNSSELNKPVEFPYYTTTAQVSPEDDADVWVGTEKEKWTSGFNAGRLWQTYAHDKDEKTGRIAEKWTDKLSGLRNNDTTHDVGFQILSSFGKAKKLTKDPEHKEVLIDAAVALSSRYNPNVGATRSWGKKDDPRNFKVIIDNMVNLGLLFEGAKLDNRPELKEMARQHALTTAKHHVNEDGSVVQLVIFDPLTGEPELKKNVQGTKNGVWSRGQAWAIKGFALAARETNDPDILDTARKVSDFAIDNMPEDGVPTWVYNAHKRGVTNRPGSERYEPKDSSAAAIMADGLLELSQIEKDDERKKKYFDAAEQILSSLSAPVERGGYLNTDLELHDNLLAGGVQNGKRNTETMGLIYGDYYYMEGINRYSEILAKQGKK